ncbi:hypothetical protein H072_4163 [Dactylellina haptotyla CBS 200.50]|uniref:Copper acquisition factor BIM1-like domain-containing protein n=1 Tax=Dactylellina haptotyla (strain CBS 200.50) TaxID=1284197 RepID=S8BR23_DACHA|nr:hypothetical protein H072_4163 [Dactylellina haptotyla CBS 200.50]
MLANTLLAVAALTSAAQAHFGVDYPPMRVDSFEDPYNQYLRPCAGANTTNNRTEWPLDGGSVVLELHHPTDYIFVNLGLGSDVTTFNISLTPNFFNNTGNGTLCLPKFPIPAGVQIQDGTNASIQVVTVNHAGNALYNCADIVFRTSATILSGDACMNTTSGPLFAVQDQTELLKSTGNNTAGDKPSSAVHGSSVHILTASLTVILAMVVASGLL